MKEYCALQYRSITDFEKEANYSDLSSLQTSGVLFQASKGKLWHYI